MAGTSQMMLLKNIMTWLNGNIFRVTGPLWGESTGHRWIPLTKASDAELWCFLWSGPEQTVEQTNDMCNLRRHRVHYDVSVMMRNIRPVIAQYFIKLFAWWCWNSLFVIEYPKSLCYATSISFQYLCLCTFNQFMIYMCLLWCSHIAHSLSLPDM